MNQAHFAAALLDPDHPPPQRLVTYNGSDPAQRFAIYRNNVVVSLIEALIARFPTVHALVGDDFFRAMARLYLQKAPPASRIMAEYGATFPHFVASFAPAAHLPYLPAVAHLEVARTLAYHAADAQPLSAQDFAALPQDRLFDLRLAFLPSAHIVSADHAIFSLWAAQQGLCAWDSFPVDQPQAVLVLRPHLDVEIINLPPGTAPFLCALQAGHPVGAAAEQAFAAQPDFDLTNAFQILLTSGVVQAARLL